MESWRFTQKIDIFHTHSTNQRTLRSNTLTEQKRQDDKAYERRQAYKQRASHRTHPHIYFPKKKFKKKRINNIFQEIKATTFRNRIYRDQTVAGDRDVLDDRFHGGVRLNAPVSKLPPPPTPLGASVSD